MHYNSYMYLFQEKVSKKGVVSLKPLKVKSGVVRLQQSLITKTLRRRKNTLFTKVCNFKQYIKTIAFKTYQPKLFKTAYLYYTCNKFIQAHELHVVTGAPVRVEVHVPNSDNRYLYRSHGLPAEVIPVLHFNQQFATKILIKEVLKSCWLQYVIVHFLGFLVDQECYYIGIL